MKVNFLNTNWQKNLMIAVLCLSFSSIATFAYAALTFNATEITSDGALTLTPATHVVINGNVGIGTDNPSALLHVTAQPTAEPGSVTVAAGGTTVTGTSTEFTSLRLRDQITFTTSSGSETRDIIAIASDTSMTTAAFTGSATNVPYTIRQNKLSVLGSGDIYTDGSLFPSFGHLFLRTNLNNYIAGGANNFLSGTQPALTFQDYTFLDRSMGFHFITDGSGPGTRIEAKGSDFSTILALTDSGNVGIGTTTPDYTLDVNGTINATSVLVNGVAVGGGGSQWISGAGGIISYSGGNVGIGMANPVTMLDINGNVRAHSDITVQAGAGNIVGGLSWASTDNGQLYLNNAGATTITIVGSGNTYFNGGNVGIGTTGPGARLTIANSTTGGAIGTAFQQEIVNTHGDIGDFTGTIYRWASGNSNTNQAFIGAVMSVANTNTLSDLVFGVKANSSVTAMTEYMRIAGGGNVGIGTTSPAVKLDVITPGAIISQFNSTAAGGGYVAIQRSGGDKGYLGTPTAVAGMADNDGFMVKASVGSLYLEAQAAQIHSATIAADTTGAAANVVIGGDRLQRSTSSIRYKDDVQDFKGGLNEILKLRPISFLEKKDHSTGRHIGFIAEEVAPIFPDIVTYIDLNGRRVPDYVEYDRLTAPIVKSIQELNLDLETVSGTITPLSDSPAESFANRFFSNLFVKITTWLANVGNGIGRFFAKEVNTETLCVSDSSGAKTCIDKTELDALIAGAASN